MSQRAAFSMVHRQAAWISGDHIGAAGSVIFRSVGAQAPRDARNRVVFRRLVSSRGNEVGSGAVAAARGGVAVTPEEGRQSPASEAARSAAGKAAKADSLAAIYLELGKARLSGLVTMTTAAGFALAVPASAPVSLKMLAITCTGTGLAAMSASAFNQIMEVPNDARMARTAKRPLVAKKITPLHATLFATSCGVGGVALLASHVNPLTAALGAANIGLYTLVYTPMKQRSVWNTWVGAVVGAIPPVMGWTAVTGGIDGGALLLGGILFSWQMPHFLSLAYMMRKDYRAGGYKMMPQEVGSPHTQRATAAAVRHCFYLQGMCVAAPYLGVCIGAPFLGIVDPFFVLEATVLNGGFLYLALQFHRAGKGSSAGTANAAARKLFLASLLYLPLLLGCMVYHRSLPAPAASADDATKGCPFLDASKIVAEQDKHGTAAGGAVLTETDK